METTPNKKPKIHSFSSPNYKPPATRASQFDSEHSLKSSPFHSDRVHCGICCKDLQNNSDTLKKHISASNHLAKLAQRQLQTKQRERFESYVVNRPLPAGTGKLLPPQHNAFRISAVRATLIAGHPMSTLDDYRELIEENSPWSLTDSSQLSTLVGDVLSLELEDLKAQLKQKEYSIYFDGTSHCGECLGVLVRFLGQDVILQKCIAYKHSDTSLDQFSLAGQLRKSLERINLPDSLCIAIGHDEASVNLKTISNFKSVGFFPSATELMCWPHLLNRAGKLLATPLVSTFMNAWQSTVCHSPARRNAFKSLSGNTCPFVTNFTRWHASYEVVCNIYVNKGALRQFITGIQAKPCVASATLSQITSSQWDELLFQMALFVDYGRELVTATYFLEGDGFLLPFTYDILTALNVFFQKGANIGPFTSAEIKRICTNGTVLNSQKASSYKAKVEASIFPVRSYLLDRINDKPSPFADPFQDLKRKCQHDSIHVAKIARFLHPIRLLDLDPKYEDLAEISRYLPSFSLQQSKLLWTEYPHYKVLCQAFPPPPSRLAAPQLVTSFHLRHKHDVPAWFHLFSKLALLQPSSASIERVNSIFERVVSADQKSSSEELIEAKVLLGYNHRKIANKQPNNS